MPLVYTLCTNKKTSTYKTILRQLKRDQPDYCPEQINIDFELAAMNAAKEVFPEAKIQYCYFHLKQSVVRNLASNGLKERFEIDTTFTMEILQMVAVAFLPVAEVRFDFANIRMSEHMNVCYVLFFSQLGASSMGKVH